MSDSAIRVENLSKRYKIGQRERYKALRDVITDAVASPFRRLWRNPQSATRCSRAPERRGAPILRVSYRLPSSVIGQPFTIRNPHSEMFSYIRTLVPSYGFASPRPRSSVPPILRFTVPAVPSVVGGRLGALE